MDLYINALIASAKMCLDPALMLLLLAGCLWGNIVGALPGIGPSLGVGILLPFTFSMNTEYAIAFIMSINVANSFGNSIPAVLIGVPGGSSAVLTALDGYALHKQGKGGLALGVTYFASVMGQFLSIFVFLALVVPLSGLTYIFLSPEMAALYFLGMCTVTSISSENLLKGIIAAAFGFSIGLIGRDPVSSVARFNFHPELRNGIDVIPLTIGLLAMSELFRSMRQSFRWEELLGAFSTKFPTAKELGRAFPRILIGTGIGSILGAIPGMSGTAPAFISYQQSRLWSKHPEEYGHGSIEGVAANEAAQNAAQAGEMVPTFGLGIPASGTMVMVLAACLVHGFLPGPQMIKQAPQMLYAATGGMMASTLILAVIGWPICLYTLKLMTLDRQLILIGCIALTMIGVFTIRNSTMDVFWLVLFGFAGYYMRRYGYSAASACIACILGPGLEGYLRKGLLLCEGSWWTFLSRPWTAAIVTFSTIMLIYGTVGTIRMARKDEAKRQKALAAYIASGMK